jgi:hypothetical protein
MSRRIAAAATVAILVGGAVLIAGADIEGGTFTSETHNVRMTLQRGWRIADQSAYPGIIVRMFRTRPRGMILVAVDPLADATKGIEKECRTRPGGAEGAPDVTLALEVQIACQQSRRLSSLGFTVGTIKEAARPWFDYSTDRRELRQGVVVLDDTVVTVVLATDTAAARAQHARTFDKALRSLRQLETAEQAAAAGDGGVITLDAGVLDAP